MMAAALHYDSHKTLGDLLPGVVASQAALLVSGLAIDSRHVRAGDVFLAYPGETADGRLFIDQAIARGAVAVIAEGVADLAGVSERSDWAVPIIRVPQLREQVSFIADRFYDQPSATMTVVGVTGTNGKTSCTQLIAQALRLLGQPCGVIGTLGNSLGSADKNASEQNKNTGANLTTPDPIALQVQLAHWRDQNVQHAAVEVSSHGLAQGRVGGIRFRGAVFTNLTRDHLDFHGTMDAYGAAKARLFEMPNLEFAIINRDDNFGIELIAKIGTRVSTLLDYSMYGNAAIAIKSAEFHAHGVRATVQTPWGEIALRSHLLGDFNLSNLLAVIGVLGQLHIAPNAIAALLPQLDPIAGRMQRVAADADIEVVVDYAHTPDALEHALTAARRHCRGKLWCVFGCGGDRDVGKRPLMGELAARLADRIVLTSDNPRGENPQIILDQIAVGIAAARRADTAIEIDRAAAISFAVRHAHAGDMILLAGKGHEDYQLIGAEIRPFNDVMVARAALLARDASAAGGIE